jgi:hypothetical protein
MLLHNGARPWGCTGALVAGANVSFRLAKCERAFTHKPSLHIRVMAWAHGEQLHMACRACTHPPPTIFESAACIAPCDLHLVVFERTLARPLQQLLHQLGQHRWQTPQSSPPALQRHALLRQPLPNASCIALCPRSLNAQRLQWCVHRHASAAL